MSQSEKAVLNIGSLEEYVRKFPLIVDIVINTVNT